MNKRGLALLLPFLLHAFPARAVSDAEVRQLLSASLEELMTETVSISTQTKQQLSRAPSVVSVITADDILATGATNLMEILNSVPGVYIKTNLFGFKPLITFRGAKPANVLTMVNGASARDLVWSHSIFWKGMPVNMIERIEVIRGPGSALFGSDASAGVINVITRTAGKIVQSEAGVRAGSFDSQAGWLRHGTNWNGFDIAFTADVSHTDGHSPFIARDRIGTPPQHASYGWDNQDLHLSIGKGNWRLLADSTQHRNVAIGLTGAAILDPLTRANESQTSLALFYGNEAFAKDWGLNAELRYRDIDYSSGNGFWERPPGPGQNLNELNSAERRLNFEVSALYKGIHGHTLRFGGGHIWHDLYFVRQLINSVPGNFAPEQTRKNGYLFAQDTWGFAAGWELTAGARYDHYSDFGGTLNPRLALVWQTTPRLTTKLMYGEAFRVPTYLELYSQTAANVPNPALRPEISKTWDLAFSWLATRDLRLGLTLYHFDQRDIITPDPATNKFENFGRLTSRGLELEAQWQATRTLRIAGNLNRISQAESDLRELSVPPQQAYLRADWAFLPKWHWNVQANWFDKRWLPPGDPRTPSGAYTLADTTLRHFHGSEWEFAASIRNLFDKDAREYSSTRLPDNLPLPRRNFYAEVKYKF